MGFFSLGIPGIASLFDVLEQRGAGVAQRLEGVLAARRQALVGVQQHGQAAVGAVHLLPRTGEKWGEKTGNWESPQKSGKLGYTRFTSSLRENGDLGKFGKIHKNRGNG